MEFSGSVTPWQFNRNCQEKNDIGNDYKSKKNLPLVCKQIIVRMNVDCLACNILGSHVDPDVADDDATVA